MKCVIWGAAGGVKCETWGAAGCVKCEAWEAAEGVKCETWGGRREREMWGRGMWHLGGCRGREM